MRRPKRRIASVQPFSMPASELGTLQGLFGPPALCPQQIVSSRATRYWAAYEALRAFSCDQVAMEAVEDFARQERGGEVL